MEDGPSVLGSTSGKEKEFEGTFVGSTKGKEKEHGPSGVGPTEVENGWGNTPNCVGTTCENASETGPTLVGEIPDGPIIGNDTCFKENGPCLDDFGPFENEETICEDVSGVNIDFGVGVDLNGVGDADINEEGCVDLNDACCVDINAEPSVVKDGAGGPSVDAEPTIMEDTCAGGVEVGAEPTVVEETGAGGVEVDVEPTGVDATAVEENLDKGGESDDSALDIRFPGEEDDDFWLAGNFDNEVGGLDDEEVRAEAFNDDLVRDYFVGVDGEENVADANVNVADANVTVGDFVAAQPNIGVNRKFISSP
jgi:hypothetical protein